MLVQSFLNCALPIKLFFLGCLVFSASDGGSNPRADTEDPSALLYSLSLLLYLQFLACFAFFAHNLSITASPLSFHSAGAPNHCVWFRSRWRSGIMLILRETSVDLRIWGVC